MTKIKFSRGPRKWCLLTVWLRGARSESQSSGTMRFSVQLSDKHDSVTRCCHVLIAAAVTAICPFLLLVADTFAISAAPSLLSPRRRPSRVSGRSMCVYIFPAVHLHHVHLCHLSVCVSVVSLTQCHHGPMGKPPPTHLPMCSVRCRVCLYSY